MPKCYFTELLMIMPVVLNTRRSKFHTLSNMGMTALHIIVQLAILNMSQEGCPTIILFLLAIHTYKLELTDTHICPSME